MRRKVDEGFVREAEEHRLRFTCRDCLLYLRDTAACGNGWPNEDHLAVPRVGDVVVFCKEFELE